MVDCGAEADPELGGMDDSESVGEMGSESDFESDTEPNSESMSISIDDFGSVCGFNAGMESLLGFVF